MKAVLFCTNPYSFGILKPLYDELVQSGHTALWYVRHRHLAAFPFAELSLPTSSVEVVMDFEPDALFVPGNQVPHYVPGVKVQVFHGFAGEKKGHFRIRHYFDLYLTQGPYFTQRFQALASRHRDFEVVETGWCKLDPLYGQREAWHERKAHLLGAEVPRKLVLFAPTFSPSLTCAEAAFEQITQMAKHPEWMIAVKFHDLMNKKVVEQYQLAADQLPGLKVVEERNILPWLAMADILISDTSSVVYEFLLLDKPVITVRTSAPSPTWRDLGSAQELPEAVMEELLHDKFAGARAATNAAYHPFSDGKSATRMVEAVQDYIARHGVPKERKLGWIRQWRMNKYFGRNPKRN